MILGEVRCLDEQFCQSQYVRWAIQVENCVEITVFCIEYINYFV